jgi:cobalt-zinc-cadmium efflux system outer membrane protein
VQASAHLPVPKADVPPKLEIPSGLPGAQATVPVLPAAMPERLKAIETYFPNLPDLGPDPLVDGQPGERAVTVEELIEYAKSRSPTIAQARAEVENVRGQWVQAGLYTNPVIGAQADQVADAGPFGQFGGFINWSLPVSGRLRLARAVAYFDYVIAHARLRRTEVELTRQVRADYAAAMVAAENVRINRLLSQFTEDVYRRQVSLLRGPLAVPSDAAALRAVAGQARATLIAARNRYVSAWKQLAATANDPEMRRVPLAGRADEVLPRLWYDGVREFLLAGHTDLAVARQQAAQAERTLVLERRRVVPDLQTNWYFEQDTLAKSQGLPSFQFGYQVGMAVPVFNRNQGAIVSAAAVIARTSREAERVRNDLLRQLADAFERYETARQQVRLYRELILPDLARAFRGVYDRYQVDPTVNYNDIVNAQQNFATQMNNYLQALQQQWQALADLGGIVQADDPRQLPIEPERTGPDTWPDAAPFVDVPPKM